MTIHTAHQRPPEYTAINYQGDAQELQTALTDATPAEAAWSYAVTTNGNDAIVTLTYNTVDVTIDVHDTDWVVYAGTTIGGPVLPAVVTDSEMDAGYIVT